MKRLKLLCALLPLFLLLSACVSATPEQRLAAASEKLARAGSLSYTAVTDLRLSAEGGSRETTVTSRVSVGSGPVAVYRESVTEASGFEQPSEYRAYIAADGERYSAYENRDGLWTRRDLDGGEELSSYDLRSNIALWASGASSVTWAGSELIDGHRATRYDCVVGPEGVDAIMAGSGAYTALPALGLSQERAMEVLSGLGELRYSVWIDNRRCLPLRYEIDMTEIMDQFLQNISSPVLSGAGVSVERVTVSLSLSDFGAVEPIELPAEALNAKPPEWEWVVYASNT